jgi:hypothetical protein
MFNRYSRSPKSHFTATPRGKANKKTISGPFDAPGTQTGKLEGLNARAHRGGRRRNRDGDFWFFARSQAGYRSQRIVRRRPQLPISQ